MNLTVDLGTIDADGVAIRATARTMPAPDVGPTCDCGDGSVTQTLEQAVGQINDNLLGAAAAMYRLGGVLSDAARALAETDRQIARG